jgi:hypothetical protein
MGSELSQLLAFRTYPLAFCQSILFWLDVNVTPAHPRI